MDCACKLTVVHISRANNIETNCPQFMVILADCNWEMVVCNYRPRAQLWTTRRAQLQNQAPGPRFATKLRNLQMVRSVFLHHANKCDLQTSTTWLWTHIDRQNYDDIVSITIRNLGLSKIDDKWEQVLNEAQQQCLAQPINPVL